MAEALRTYGGVNGAQRRADRRAQLLAAALELLGSPGGELTVRGACRVARVATRYFYESFADRDALAAAVYDQVVAEVGAAAAAAVDHPGTPHVERVRAGVGAIVAVLADDPRKGRVLFGPEHAARHGETARLFVRLFVERQRGPDDLVATFAVGGLGRVLEAWLVGDLDAPREHVVQRCAALLVAAQRAPGEGFAPGT
ncbi:TetR/AcrR family transcriptional regulator [Pseudonocardia nantongensis]|uniref:TetR/AcrR family transcriptional regulator n=1 Tax=Pseudonocardia nantongensis TaxID=1181885 RepID=UPI003979E929